MITFFIDMLQLPNFDHITTFTIKFKSHDKNLLVTSWTEIMTPYSVLQNTFILRRPGVAIFADIIEIVVMFFRTIIKDSRKVKRIRNYVSKSNLYLYILMQQNLQISSEKMLISAELKGFITLFLYFLDLPQVRYNCAKFHHCRICVTDFREGRAIREQPRTSLS